VLLDQLRRQTVAPREVLVVDQSEPAAREPDIATAFSDLPLTVLQRDVAGQCSSRNAALRRLRSEYVLFIDDDDEVDAQLIERHLGCIDAYGADSSSGIAHELETGPPPPLPETRSVRLSDVFPTNNTLVRREALVRSGLFDLAYERHPRADGDLGMRLYLSGALMVLDDGNRVLHHRAPSGGLRQHRARVVTARTSRARLLHRHLPAVSEIYMLHRYFSARQRTEMLWIRALTTFVGKGPWYRRALKAVVGLTLLPDTIAQIRARAREAESWLGRFPDIESL
jgi:glycosyltransferase involved in cell wall biosynthesis